ncbi:TPA: hypothetical protein ACLBF0_001409, partial [Neisseria meningitidis]
LKSCGIGVGFRANLVQPLKFFVFKPSPLAIGVKFFYDKHIDCKQSVTSRFVFSEDIIPVRRYFYIFRL